MNKATLGVRVTLAVVLFGAAFHPALADLTQITIDVQQPVRVGTTVTYTAQEDGTRPATSYKWEYACQAASCGPNGGPWITASGTGQSIAFIESSSRIYYAIVTGNYINYSTTPPTGYTVTKSASVNVVAPTSDGPADQGPGGTNQETANCANITPTFVLS